ncbi:MAG: RNA repair domain-containing protein [Thermoplasmatota archaeon]
MSVRFPRDLLLKLKWTGHGLDDVSITITSRSPRSDMGIVPGSDIVHLGRSFFELSDGTRIPYHRIRYIEYGRGKIWQRSR